MKGYDKYMYSQDEIQKLFLTNNGITMEVVLIAFKYQKEIGIEQSNIKDNWLHQFATYIQHGNKLNAIQLAFVRQELLLYIESIAKVVKREIKNN